MLRAACFRAGSSRLVEPGGANVSQQTPESAIARMGEERVATSRVPRATYRFQFNADWTFDNARSLVAYLTALGISDAYASPILQARAGSTHGYDITDPTVINPVLGGEEAFNAWSAALKKAGLGLIVDMVPNHMGIGDPSNRWWMDILENGPGSSYAAYFDIDWQPVKPEMENVVLLPILGDQYGNVLESRQLQLSYEDGTFWLSYYQTRLPIAPRTYRPLLQQMLERLVAAIGPDDEHVQELQSILTALSYLPPRTEVTPEKLTERNREKEVVKRRIIALYDANAQVQAALAGTLEAYNGVVGDPHSFDDLDRLIGAQPYRLAYWRVAAEEINYRRFFDINDLAAIRVEVPEVFEETHRLLFRLIDEGKINGLRIDHPDGLWNPPHYFRKLQSRYLFSSLRERLPNLEADVLEQMTMNWLAQHASESEAAEWPLYVVAEKILSEHEPLARDWAVDGTTGYDFLNAVNGIFVDRSNRAAFDKVYTTFLGSGEVGDRFYVPELMYRMKQMIMQISLASEINSLAHQLDRIGERNRHYRDFTLFGLTTAIREFIACLGIYRTYVQVDEGTLSRRDQQYVIAAIKEAKRRNPGLDASLFDYLHDTLLLRNEASFTEADRVALKQFVMRFQQMTGPVMAKAVEDTAFYIYNRLVSLNEVGGHPEEFGISVANFHRDNAARQRFWPHAMLTTSTHDTKRSEDVRARIDVLSEMPQEWGAAVERWCVLNEQYHTFIDDERVLDRNDEYLLYQSLVGAWPSELLRPAGTPLDGAAVIAFRERILAYMKKATNEAKVHTSWLNPKEAYDTALRDFVLQLLPDGGDGPFMQDLMEFTRTVAFYGWFNALSQQLLKLTSPGVPDIYQGTELWDLSLVDPDNRRPVDYGRRQRLLAELQERTKRRSKQWVALAKELVDECEDGRIKLYITFRTLAARRDHEQLWSHGTYQPLEATGDKQEYVCAFWRSFDTQAMVVLAPRLVVGLTGGEMQSPLGAEVWGDTRVHLPDAQVGQRFRNIFTGETLTVELQAGKPAILLAMACAHFPVAVLLLDDQ
ncbi:MAG: malto-oligosyltrehalose synthase [Herpetosiphon sp.]